MTCFTVIHSANKGNVMLHVNKIDLSLFWGPADCGSAGWTASFLAPVLVKSFDEVSSNPIKIVESVIRKSNPHSEGDVMLVKRHMGSPVPEILRWVCTSTKKQ